MPIPSTEKAVKAPQNNTPKNLNACAYYRWAWPTAPSPSAVSMTPSKESPSSRETVRWLLSALSSGQTQRPPILSKDLDSFSRAIKAIITAEDDKVIDQEEANAIIEFMAECFTRRRMDEV